MKDIRNYWLPVSPMGGRGNTAFTYNPASAKNIEGYFSPSIIQRIKHDPQTWKDALIEAEIPKPNLAYRVRLQQLYMDVIFDGHVWACIDRRKDQVLLKDFGIFEKDKEDEKATEIINNAWFSEIISHCLDARFFGYTAVGLGNIVNNQFEDIKLIRRPNVSPDRLNIAQTPYSPSGIQFRDPAAKDEFGNAYNDWILWFPTPSDFGISPCGYGLLYKVGLYQVLLRNNLSDNATYNELFGQPLRVGKTEKKDQDSRNAFGQFLDQMGSAAWTVIDKEDEIEFHEAASAGKGNMTYDNFEQRLEKKISKIILGHADALDSIPGKLGNSNDDNPASRAMADKEKHDTAFVENLINSEVLPKLIKLGFKIPVGKKFKFKNDKEKAEIENRENQRSSSMATIVKTFADAGYELDPKQIEERTGLKIVKKAEPEPLVTNPNVPKQIKNKLDNLYR